MYVGKYMLTNEISVSCYLEECTQLFLLFQLSCFALDLFVLKEISQVRSLQHEQSYHSRKECCLAINHNEQLALGNGDVDNRVHMQHQWQCLFFEEGSNFVSLLA